MNIIGINDLSHDMGVAYIKNNLIVSAAEEERFSRIKHDSGFLRGGSGPKKSFDWILDKNNLKIKKVDYFAFGWDINLLKWFKNKFSMWNFYKKTGIKLKKNFSGKYPEGYVKTTAFELSKDILSNYFKRKKYLKQFQKKKCKFVDHHLSHASLAYRISKFNKSIIFVIDGAGETKSTSVFIGSKNDIKLVKSYPIKQSIGVTYAIITRLLGMGNDAEGKTMALADYGKPIKNTTLLKYSEKKDKFIVNTQQIKEFQKYRRTSDQPILQIHKNIAATLQSDVNKSIMKFMELYIKRYNQKNVCFCGGVSLNCKFNGMFIEKYPKLNFFSPAAASDSGTAIGAALEVASQNKKVYGLNQRNFFLGYSTTNKEVLKLLKKTNLKYKKIINYDKLVDDLIKGKIIGICKGKAEIGPRALGNRSILTLANTKTQKDKLNLQIKHRENWRPFAIAILEDELSEYFNKKLNSPFMNMALIANKKALKKIPAAIHVDKSVRIQTVNKFDSPNLYTILTKLKKRTGYGVLLNTSFNDNGEPIVNSPKDALKTFEKTNLDVLYLENYRITK